MESRYYYWNDSDGLVEIENEILIETWSDGGCSGSNLYRRDLFDGLNACGRLYHNNLTWRPYCLGRSYQSMEIGAEVGGCCMMRYAMVMVSGFPPKKNEVGVGGWAVG